MTNFQVDRVEMSVQILFSSKLTAAFFASIFDTAMHRFDVLTEISLSTKSFRAMRTRKRLQLQMNRLNVPVKVALCREHRRAFVTNMISIQVNCFDVLIKIASL